MSHCERCRAPAEPSELEPCGPFLESMCARCREDTTLPRSSSSSAPTQQRRPYTPPRIDESGKFGREHQRDND